MNAELAAQQANATQLNVIATIHPNDFIYRFLCELPALSKAEAIKQYYHDASNSALSLKKLLKEVCGYKARAKLSVLEFASGFGCVTRHLKNVLPNCSTTACDIHPEAIDFLRDELGVDAALSANLPEDLDLGRTYDVIFVLSFFSHMPKSTFSRWLRKLGTLLNPGGHLIFTTHGMESQRVCIPYCIFDDEGFFFRSQSDQKDLNTAEYGTTCTKTQYVLARIFEVPELSLKCFQEGYWWGHQDLWVIQHREPIPTSPDLGSLDVVNSSEISGWVWNSRKPNQTFEVEIYDGDRLLIRLESNAFRHDLLSAKIGSGQYAFRFPMPPELNDGEPHQLRAIVVGTDFELKNSPKTYQRQ
jgi:2-polyprenyl-3-methyl-5-hydroxy-6-metoxy-1,4-benzoquinol methylase